jgi:predicted dinucleotide-binding enzyme
MIEVVCMKVAIIGTGNVGKSLYEGFLRAGCEVRFGSRHPEKSETSGTMAQKEAAKWGDIVVFAVPYGAVSETLESIGINALKGKIVVDVTNVLNQNWELALGFATSGAEELAKQIPGAKVLKAFNTVFAANQSKGRIDGEALTLFVAGDDAGAKKTLMDLGRKIGFDPVDAGPLKSARYLEPMGVMIIGMAFGAQKMGAGIGYKLVRGK